MGVEQAYSSTRQSTREIGKAFGISHTMVVKHCGGKGLERPPKEEKKAKKSKKAKESTERKLAPVLKSLAR